MFLNSYTSFSRVVSGSNLKRHLYMTDRVNETGKIRENHEDEDNVEPEMMLQVYITHIHYI